MKKIPRLFWFGALILILLTAACGAEQGATPTLSGTLPALQDTPTLGAPDTTQTVETATAGTAETATKSAETPTATMTKVASTSATATGASQTPAVPVTGLDIVLVECQFCIDTIAHALLVLPDTATFQVVTPSTTTTTSTTAETITTTCSTIEVNNGKQVVLCSGPEMTPITLNICTDANTCTDFPVDLLACPLKQAGTAVPNETQVTPGTGSATPTPTAPSTPSATPTP